MSTTTTNTKKSSTTSSKTTTTNKNQQHQAPTTPEKNHGIQYVASFFSSVFNVVIYNPLRVAANGVSLLWNLGNQIRDVYERGIPDEQRREDKQRSMRLVTVFGCFCCVVLVKDSGSIIQKLLKRK